MLVFRRKVGDGVIIDGRIEVQVLEVSGSRVKLGFSAPPEVTVMRKELFLTQEENRRAAAFRATGNLARLVTVLRTHAPEYTTRPEPPPA
ncbi:MAG: carbon storage regulator [Bryobacteraceae bacterium]